MTEFVRAFMATLFGRGLLLLPLAAVLAFSCASKEKPLETDVSAPPAEQNSELAVPVPVEAVANTPEPVISKITADPTELNHKIHLLSSQITTNLKEYDPEMKSMVFTTIVDLDNLDNTSRFGRYVSERLIHEAHRAGYRVYEIRQAENILFMENKGEFHLTRKGSALLNKYRSDAVVVGTYSHVQDILTIHIRMLDHDTSRIISVGTATFMLKDDAFAQALINVKDIGAVETGTVVTLRPMGFSQ